MTSSKGQGGKYRKKGNLMHSTIHTRRHFIKASMAVAGMISPQLVSSKALGRGQQTSANDRITLGVIGTGDHGVNRNIKRFLTEPDCQIVAVCDVDRERRHGAKKLIEQRYGEERGESFRGCDDYNDFREIIARSDVDAVMNATPDHWHVIPSVMAVNAGKDVMCEKPLSLTVMEGRALSDAVTRNHRVFQTASENRSVEVYHRMCELVRNGRIGKLKEIYVDLPSGYTLREASFEETKPPEGFDYDLWLGQAPEAPYCEARCHWNFRWLLDYSGGMLTDWGAHLMDLAQWANDTEYTGPVEVSGKGEFPEEGLYDAAKTFEIEYRYANGVRLVVRSHEPGIRFVGTDGWIGNDGWRASMEAEPASLLEEKIGEEETHLYTCSAGEQRNFLDCIKTRKLCYAPAEIGHRTISIAHIGNISMMLKRKLEWDPERERFVDDAVANWLLSRPMREPWTLDLAMKRTM